MKKTKSKAATWLILVVVIFVAATIFFNALKKGLGSLGGYKGFDPLIIPKGIWSRLSKMLGLGKTPLTPAQSAEAAGTSLKENAFGLPAIGSKK